tara:strand:- start:22556 stop:22762 length:207 start_codon:yes stop_codon:yes gene_type:complete
MMSAKPVPNRDDLADRVKEPVVAGARDAVNCQHSNTGKLAAGGYAGCAIRRRVEADLRVDTVIRMEAC